MTTIGAYAFVTHEWEYSDYPLDLWLEYHLQLFDYISIVTYGEFDLPIKDPRLLVRSIPEPCSRQTESNRWNCIGKQLAQELLPTDWKFLLDIDEFIKDRPIPNETANAHTVNVRNLFGNVNHQLIGANVASDGLLPWNKLHKGNCTVVDDGQAPKNPCSGDPIEIFHTTLLRRPLHVAARVSWNIAKYGGFDYSVWREFWPNAQLIRVYDHELPEVLVQNKKRFHYAWLSLND